MQTRKHLTIIGGGLAGSEAAWQAAERGHTVHLVEMRPKKLTPAHTTGNLAELICSNSLGSRLPDRASGLLQNELRFLSGHISPGNIPSLLLTCAEQTSVPAGGALAVDRDKFSQAVTHAITTHSNIKVIRQEALDIPPAPCIIASGPLSSPDLTIALQKYSGRDNLFFYDAIAPSVLSESINMKIAFRASRYARGEQTEGDYINCPLNKDQYIRFLDALLSAQRIPLREFEIQERSKSGEFFEGCLPIEELAARGANSLAYGPMRPIGLVNPHDNSHPFAVVQLRQDNLAGSIYNIVGFQTNLTYTEQKRVLRLIPGLENAEFSRFGQMHRNTYISSPSLLNMSLQARQNPGLFFAGQITGVEGYMGNIATGWLAGVNASRWIQNFPLLEPPRESILGSILYYITHAEISSFQPVKAIFGILPPLENPSRNRQERSSQYVERALSSLKEWTELQG